MFGVVTCPRCGTAQGADLSHIRIRCVRCGNMIDVSKAAVHFSTDSPQELADAVRRTAELKRGQEVPFPVPRGISGGKTAREAEDVIEELGRARDAITAQDISKELGVAGAELDELIARLLAAGIIYETGPGTYRVA